MLVLMRTFLFYLTKIEQAFNIHKPYCQPGNVFLKEIYRTESMYIMYKDKLQNCSIKQSE